MFESFTLDDYGVEETEGEKEFFVGSFIVHLGFGKLFLGHILIDSEHGGLDTFGGFGGDFDAFLEDCYGELRVRACAEPKSEVFVHFGLVLLQIFDDFFEFLQKADR